MDGVRRVELNGYVCYSMIGPDGLERQISLPVENEAKYKDKCLALLQEATDDLAPLVRVH